MHPTGGPTRHRYKVIVLGAPAAGKTALVRRLAEGTFQERARQRGLDFYTCQISLREDFSVTLQLWDLSDCPCRPEDDHTPLSTYIYNSQAILFVYDVSCPASLEALRHTLVAIDAAVNRSTGARPHLALVAAKTDLQQTVSEPLARELAARHSCVRYRLSAKTGYGVSHTAIQLAADLAGVPLAATDHRHLLLPVPSDPRAPLAPDGARLLSFSHEQPPTESNTGLSGPTTAAPTRTGSITCLNPGSLPSAAEPWAAAEPQPQSHAQGLLHSRAPVYQASPEPGSQGSYSVSVSEMGFRGLGGELGAGGGGAPSWRAGSSRRTTPSPTAMLISKKTGPMGQRVPGGGGLSDAVGGSEDGGGGGGRAMSGQQPGSTNSLLEEVSETEAEGSGKGGKTNVAAGEAKRRQGWRRVLWCCGS